ncbi:MAG: ribonuclease P protein component [Planctomycetota bacterium]
MKLHGFSKKQRILKNKEFMRVFKRGRSLSNDLLFVHIIPNELGYCRLGLAIGKEVHLAVWRNRIKRLIRESFRLNKPALCGPAAGLDIIVRLRYDRKTVKDKKVPVSQRKLDKKIKTLKLPEVQKSLMELLGKLPNH